MAGSYLNLTRMVPTTEIFGSWPKSSDHQDIAKQKPLGSGREQMTNGWLNNKAEEAQFKSTWMSTSFG